MSWWHPLCPFHYTHHSRIALFILQLLLFNLLGSPCGSAGKESACNAGDLGLIPELGRSFGEGNSYILQYSGLENSLDCIVHGISKSWTRLSHLHFHLPWPWPHPELYLWKVTGTPTPCRTPLRWTTDIPSHTHKLVDCVYVDTSILILMICLFNWWLLSSLGTHCWAWNSDYFCWYSFSAKMIF